MYVSLINNWNLGPFIHENSCIGIFDARLKNIFILY